MTGTATGNKSLADFCEELRRTGVISDEFKSRLTALTYDVAREGYKHGYKQGYADHKKLQRIRSRHRHPRKTRAGGDGLGSN